VIQQEFSGSVCQPNGTLSSGPKQYAGTDSGNVLTIIGTVTSQGVLITALFYYFGWVYTHGLFDYFGVDPNLVGYGTVDYALRSINVAFYPFIVAAFAALVLFGIHRIVIAPGLLNDKADPLSLSNMVTPDLSGSASLRHAWPTRLIASLTRSWGRQRQRPARIRWLLGALRLVAIICASVVFVGILFPGQVGIPLGLAMPLLLIVSVALLGYVAHMCSRYPNAALATTITVVAPPSRAYTLTLLALGLIAGLWAVSLYGNYAGVHHAKDVATRLASQSGIVVYSTERVALSGPGIAVAEIAQSGSKYHYQYTGLRLLAHASDKYLLLPSAWQHGRDRVFLLRDSDSIRVDIAVRN